MIVYKLDKPIQMKADSQIKDMGAVLSEITPTLRILRELLVKHKASLSEKNIDHYREELLQMITESMRLTHLIAINSQRLITISDFASKQLSSIDNQIAGAFQGRPAEQTPAQAATTPAPNAKDSNQAATPRTARAMSFSQTLSRV